MRWQHENHGIKEILTKKIEISKNDHKTFLSVKVTKFYGKKLSGGPQV